MTALAVSSYMGWQWWLVRRKAAAAAAAAAAKAGPVTDEAAAQASQSLEEDEEKEKEEEEDEEEEGINDVALTSSMPPAIPGRMQASSSAELQSSFQAGAVTTQLV